ncbi:cilia- and flagella-associated protein 58-like [Pomacea canaliculata]|nr:cilia- and flagella-associated protein 58-like [Pomacea canaliculata]
MAVANSRINNLTREKDNAVKLYGKQAKSMEKQTDLLHLQERTNHTLSREIMGFQRESEKQRRIITQLELERDRYLLENDNLSQRYMKCMEEIQVRDLQIMDGKKHVEEVETRLKMQQNLYEAVHADRNNYSFKLVETQDEMAVMRNKVHVLEHQSQQLKEEVAATEALVNKEHVERSRVEKERDAASAEVQTLKAKVHEANEAIQELKMTECKLLKIISATDRTCKQQKRELDKILNERDVLGSQLVRRNDEMSLLYEKTRLLTMLMNKGYVAYYQRLEDIRLLRLEVKRLRNDKRCLEKTVQNVHDYRQELYQCHRDLLHERARCAALETELSHPRQIHRWRGLQISDPSRFELIQKVQMLQKRLISRTEEIVEVERVLQEKDRLYVELRAVLERQPGPEIIEQLAVYQRVLRNKNKQLKQLTAELNMFETDTKLQKHDINKMEKEVTDLKKKYYKEKKHRQENLDKKIFGFRRALLPRPQFTGGGFKLSV